jgi:hypothetical protein
MTMTVDDEDIRLAIYEAFALEGRPPTIVDVATLFDLPASDVRAAWHRLAGSRHIVLDGSEAVVMAHPFASIPLGFSVMGRRTLWWGGCAWDSFAVPHLVPGEDAVLVATRCPACGTAHAWAVDRHGPPDGDQVAHFLVPVARIWDDVVHTCGHQRLFCDEACVDRWLAESGNDRGYVMDLATLWRLARGWYAGRLDHGYRRRDPAGSAAYFREVGLDGPFWGL